MYSLTPLINMVPGLTEIVERPFYMHILFLLRGPGESFTYSLNKHAECQLLGQMLGMQKDAKVKPSQT